MHTAEILKVAQALGATDDQVTAIGDALTKKKSEPITPQDRRTLNYRQAADELGVSKTTVRRLVRAGRLATVETRLGRKRVLSQSITNFILG